MNTKYKSKMNTKYKRKMNKKLMLSIVVLALVSIGSIAGIVTVLALSSRTIDSAMFVRFMAIDIDGEVEAAYRVGNAATWTSMSGTTPYVFKATDQESNKQMNPGDISLTSTNNFVEFRYTFRNFGDVDYTGLLTLDEVDQNNNMTIEYKYNDASYSTASYGLVVEGVDTASADKIKTRDGKKYTEMVYYIKIQVKELNKSANYSSDFFWLLERYEAVAGESLIKLSSCEFSSNGDGTFSAAYNGSDISVVNSASASAKAGTEEHVWYVPSRFGSAAVTKVVQGKSFPKNTKVVITDGIKSIEDKALSNQTGLVSLFVGDGLTSIGSNAFYCCENLKNAELGKNIISIGARAFEKCSNLISVNLGESLQIIGEHSFENCSKLTNVVFPDSLKSIGGYAFAQCGSLTEAYLADTSATLSGGVFMFCSKLEKASFSRSTLIPYGTYANCTNLRSVEIPDTVKEIGQSAFGLCSNLTDVNLSNNVTIIGGDSFQECSNLETIKFPENLQEICFGAFARCSKLKEINLSQTSVKTISTYAFQNCSSVKFINIPSSVTSISSRAFAHCGSVEEMQFNADLTSNPTTVDSYVFIDLGLNVDRCVVYVGDNVSKLTNYLFINSNITCAYIPSSTTLGTYVFANTPNLEFCSWNGSSFKIGGNYELVECGTENMTRAEFKDLIENPPIMASGKTYYSIYKALEKGETEIEIYNDIVVNKRINITNYTIDFIAKKDVTFYLNVDDAIYIYSGLYVSRYYNSGAKITFKAGNGVTGNMFNINQGYLTLGEGVVVDGNGTARGVIAGNEAAYDQDPTTTLCYVYIEGAEIKNCYAKEGSAIGIYYNSYLGIRSGKIHSNSGATSSTSDSLSGAVVISRGMCNMTGGEISNNVLTGKTGTILKSTSYGAGVCVTDGGHFEMHAGSVIKNNRMTGGNTLGANIYVGQETMCLIYGGTIESTSATADALFGGAIANTGYLYMLGGTLKNTKATTGGGVANAGEFYMIGGVISGCNSVDTNGNSTSFGNAIITNGQLGLVGGAIYGDISIGYQSGILGYGESCGSVVVGGIIDVAQMYDQSISTEEEANELFTYLTGNRFEGLKGPYTLTMCALNTSNYTATQTDYFYKNYANKSTLFIIYSSYVEVDVNHFTLEYVANGVNHRLSAGAEGLYLIV